MGVAHPRMQIVLQDSRRISRQLPRHHPDPREPRRPTPGQRLHREGGTLLVRLCRAGTGCPARRCWWCDGLGPVRCRGRSSGRRPSPVAPSGPPTCRQARTPVSHDLGPGGVVSPLLGVAARVGPVPLRVSWGCGGGCRRLRRRRVPRPGPSPGWRVRPGRCLHRVGSCTAQPGLQASAGPEQRIESLGSAEGLVDIRTGQREGWLGRDQPS